MLTKSLGVLITLDSQVCLLGNGKKINPEVKVHINLAVSMELATVTWN